MGCLAWLVAMIGVGAASLALAASAPAPAWWVLALVVAALLAGPHLLQWWLRRARRTGRLAARWWAAGPGPAEVAFLCGGPGRVVDLVVAGLVAEGRLTVGDDGRLAEATPAGPGAPDVSGADSGAGAPEAPESVPGAGALEAPEPVPGAGAPDGAEAAFRREILDRLSHGPTDVAALRFAVRSTPAVTPLWGAAARQGLLLPAWRREYTHWYVAGAVVAVGYFVAVALAGVRSDLAGLTFWIGAGVLGLGVLALWRVRFLVGYGFDPRTAAGLRAASLARAGAPPGDRRYRVAVEGLRSARDLRPGARDRHPVPPSRWHVPWYARSVPERATPWWRAVDQTDHAGALHRPDDRDAR